MASLKAITHRRQKIWRYRLMANLKGANVSHISPHCRLNLLLDVFVQKRQNLFIGSNSSMWRSSVGHEAFIHTYEVFNSGHQAEWCLVTQCLTKAVSSCLTSFLSTDHNLLNLYPAIFPLSYVGSQTQGWWCLRGDTGQAPELTSWLTPQALSPDIWSCVHLFLSFFLPLTTWYSSCNWL